MTQIANEQIIALASELVDRAAQENIPVRVLGGVAVRMACPSIGTHPALQRPIKDIDLVARQSDFEKLATAFDPLGARLQSKEKGQWVFEKYGTKIEVTSPDYVEDHRIDLSPRLALNSPTLPLADLILLKLQRIRFAEKDIQDTIALLLDHRVASGETEGQINQDYIAQLCARDWGLFKTAYANTVTLENVLDKYVESEQAQRVWRRVEQIQGAMDSAPKSVGWMLNQILRRPFQIA